MYKYERDFGKCNHITYQGLSDWSVAGNRIAEGGYKRGDSHNGRQLLSGRGSDHYSTDYYSGPFDSKGGNSDITSSTGGGFLYGHVRWHKPAIDLLICRHNLSQHVDIH
jgi:hypothetical protein